MPFTVVKVLHLLFCLTNHERLSRSRKVVCTQSVSHWVSQSVWGRPQSTKHTTSSSIRQPLETLSRRNVKVFFPPANTPLHEKPIFENFWFALAAANYFTRVGVTFFVLLQSQIFYASSTPAVQLTRALLLSPVKNQPPRLTCNYTIFFSRERRVLEIFLCWTRQLYTRRRRRNTLLLRFQRKILVTWYFGAWNCSKI